MEAMAFIFGLAGIALAIKVNKRVTALENKLKELKLIDEGFHSETFSS
jgi:hypothetical protein